MCIRDSLEVHGRRQFLGDDEGMLPRRIAAALAVGDRGHGRYAGLVQAPDGLPLLARAEHRKLGGEEVRCV